MSPELKVKLGIILLTSGSGANYLEVEHRGVLLITIHHSCARF